MGIKDSLGSIFGGKRSTARPGVSRPSEPMPDIVGYAGIKTPDEDLFEAATRLMSLSEDILAGSTRRPPDTTALVESCSAACSKAATAWIKSEYSLPEFLADSYGKSWLNAKIAKDMVAVVCRASAISDGQVSAALKKGLEHIAIGSAAMMIHGLFVASKNPQAPTATKNAAGMAGAAKTFILGL